jgi:aminoglycoside phosphotransferase (APT) family kinase protein
MRALGGAGFPVPRVRCLCEQAEIAGTAFYVMDFVAGRVVWEPAMPGFDRGDRGSVYDTMVVTLADLHDLDPSAIELGDFGRGENYVARQLTRWSDQYRASRTADIVEMDRLINWLPTRIPKQQRVSVVHGDYRLDNIILSADRPEIRAVIDWELATLGDPIADFTNLLMQWRMPPSETGAGTGSLVGLDLDKLGIPDLDTVIARYEARTGLAVRPNLDFYLAYNFFRIAAILQGIVGRVRDGTATNPNAAAMAAQVRPIAETAWRIAEAGGRRI